MVGRQNEMEQEIEFQPFNGTPSSRVVNNTTLTRTFYTPTSGIVYACVIVLLLFSNCILLGRVASSIQGTNSELQVQRQNVEYKTVVWNEGGYEGDLRSFFQVMMREGLTNNTFASCSWSKYGKPEPDKAYNNHEGEWLTYYDNTDRISRGCVIDAWLNKAAETKWLATNLLATIFSQNPNGVYPGRPYVTFTRTTYTV